MFVPEDYSTLQREINPPEDWEDDSRRNLKPKHEAQEIHCSMYSTVFSEFNQEIQIEFRT